MGRKDCSDGLEQNFQLNLGKILDHLPQIIKIFLSEAPFPRNKLRFLALKRIGQVSLETLR